ncbi:MAG: hypothetical protein AAF481_02725 [Acidobacteriota bacterium]
MDREQRVMESRQRVEDRLAEVQEAFRSELGIIAPERRAWRLGLVAAAAGLAIAIGLKRRRKQRSR